MRERYHHGSLPDALVRVSIELIGRDGVERFSLAKAARAAGVSPAAPYAHFADKAELLQAVAERGYHALDTALRETMDGPDPVECLVAMGHAYIAFVLDNAAVGAIMFAPQYRRPPAAAGLRAKEALAELIARIEAEGRLRVPPLVAVNAVWALLHGFAVLTSSGLLDSAGTDGNRPGVRDAVLRAVFGTGLART